ncbi:MAG: FAD binding domain-containing protein [Jatrophihabitantaceae bacterium]
MKPGAFEYVRPSSVAEAVAVLAETGEDASILAGGQSLVPLLNMRLARPAILVDINRIAGLDGLEVSGDGVRVGTLVRAGALERNAQARVATPVLAQASSNIGHPQIRNRTTVGGNIAHADPSSELPSVLACLDGEVELISSSGARTIGWSDFFVTVFTTAREPAEMVTGVRFPTEPGWEFHFTEMARRHGDFPIVALTVGLNWQDERLSGLRVAATGVSDRPLRLSAVEQAATGEPLTAALVAELAALAAAECDPRSDGAGSAEYRRHVLATLLRRTLTDRIGRRTTPAAA